ncbi:MAG: phosphatidylinositol-specific phospholipase C domain-containing protein [Paraprevotella sp.]|nr:phosphatidylinositol-specific phospholipase C domain-containing protein [Paraprevotella sp.]
MKKNKYMYLFAVVLGVGLSACSSDDLATEEQGMQGTGAAATAETSVVFTSRIADGLDMLDGEEEQTRSAIVNGQIARWTQGDAISVSDGTLAYTYQVKETTSDTFCSFEVKPGSNEFTADDSGRKFYAFYPEAAITGAAGRGGWNGSKVKAMIFAEQKYAENMDDGLFGAYMASEATELKDGNADFTFHLVAGVIDVDLSALGVTPKSVSLRANSGVSLAGLLAYNCASGTASVSTADRTDYAVSTQSEVVTVSDIASDATLVRLYVLPVQLDGGVTITVQDTNGNFYTKTASATVGNPATEGLTSIDGLAGATVCKPYYKKFNFGAASKATRVNNWMATIPGNTKFNLLSIPGAHDAATSTVTGLLAGPSKTQSKAIAELLEAGVRALDIRPGYKGSKEFTSETLLIYHGSTNTNVKFVDAMDAVKDFLIKNPTETVLISLLKESNGSGTDQSASWCDVVRGYLESIPEYVLQQVTAEMTISECRGKMVVVSRTPYGPNSTFAPVYGALIRDWGDANISQPNLYYNGYPNTVIAPTYVQDSYNEKPSDNKKGLVKETLDKSVADLSTRWYYNCLNVAFSGVSNPSAYANTMNPYVESLLGSYSGRIGVMLYDFCGDGSYGGDKLNKAIIGQNHKYVYNNRSRIHMPDNTGTGIDGGEMADDSEVYSIELR